MKSSGEIRKPKAPSYSLKKKKSSKAVISEKQLKSDMDASWRWFQISANQRMQAVNYYLIAAAFLWQAYAKMETTSVFDAFVLGCLGCVMTLVFYKVERRTHFLVNTARDSIKELEKQLKKHNKRFPQIVNNTAGQGPGSYSSWFRILFLTSGIAFMAMAIPGQYRRSALAGLGDFFHTLAAESVQQGAPEVPYALQKPSY